MMLNKTTLFVSVLAIMCFTFLLPACEEIHDDTIQSLVDIEITPTNPTIAKDTNHQFIATGIYVDNTKQDLTTLVTWNSLNDSVATINSKGLATAGNIADAVVITATLDTIRSLTVLTITTASLDRIEVSPTDPSIAGGTTQQFTATGIFSDSTTQDLAPSITWRSSDTNVATINSEGLATAGNVSMTTTIRITATLGVVSGSTNLTVTAASLDRIDVTPVDTSIAKDTKLQFTATGIFSDSTSQDLTTSVTWSWEPSPDGSVEISNTAGSEGMLTGLAKGRVKIAATFETIGGSTTLTITEAVLTSIEVNTPDGGTIASIPEGTTLQFTATGNYSDGTTQDLTTSVTWRSSNTSVATINNTVGNEGLAKGEEAGTAIIIAIDPLTDISGSATLIVTDYRHQMPRMPQ